MIFFLLNAIKILLIIKFYIICHKERKREAKYHVDFDFGLELLNFMLFGAGFKLNNPFA